MGKKVNFPTEEILKKCPFCGGTAIWEQSFDLFSKGSICYSISCNNCGISTLPMNNRVKVIQIWNKRDTHK
jgi:Lar family restriction alleviation protein